MVHLEFQPIYSGTGTNLQLSECLVCPSIDGRRPISAKKNWGKHKETAKHKSYVKIARSELQTQRATYQTSLGNVRIHSEDDADQASMMNPEDMDMSFAGVIDISQPSHIADAPIKLPGPSQDLYEEYRMALSVGDVLFEVRLPPYKEVDDIPVGFDHNDKFIQRADFRLSQANETDKSGYWEANPAPSNPAYPWPSIEVHFHQLARIFGS